MGKIGMLKEGLLAWLLWQGGVVVDVVDHNGNISLRVYRREEGEEIVNTEQTMHHKAQHDDGQS